MPKFEAELEDWNKLLSLEEVSSDFPDYNAYMPKNRKLDESNSIRFYLSEKYLIQCAKFCRYKRDYNKQLIYSFSFDEKELLDIDKIDLSVRTLIKRFIILSS